MSYLRNMSCVALLALSALAPGQRPAASLGAHHDLRNPQATTPAASNMPEVRLRKLHLVRPDLIPYPIAYDVYC